MAISVSPIKSRNAIQLISAKQMHAAQIFTVCLMKAIKYVFPQDSVTFKEKKVKAASLTVCVILKDVSKMDNATLRQFHKNWIKQKIRNLQEFAEEAILKRVVLNKEICNHTTTTITLLYSTLPTPTIITLHRTTHLHHTTTTIIMDLPTPIHTLNIAPKLNLTTILTAITAPQI